VAESNRRPNLSKFIVGVFLGVLLKIAPFQNCKIWRIYWRWMKYVRFPPPHQQPLKDGCFKDLLISTRHPTHQLGYW
jgi:hypothetical protein